MDRKEELLRKLFSRKITKDELTELNSWYDSFDDQQELTIFLNDAKNEKEVKNRILQKIKNETTIQKTFNVKFRSYSSNPTTSIAVIAVVVMLLCTYLFLNSNSTQKLNVPVEVEYVEKSNPKGKRSKLSLQDGTKIWLNSESTIKIPKHFEDDKREIILVGEAFFEVKRDEKRPFIVKTENLITKVLGTSFNIRAHENEEVQLTVASGKVSAKQYLMNNQDSKEYILVKGDQIKLDTETGYVNKITVNSGNFSAWKDGSIIFNEAKLSYVEETLERWYDVDITIANKNLKNCELFGEYHNEKLSNILESMKYALDITYEFSENKVWIYGAGCN